MTEAEDTNPHFPYWHFNISLQWVGRAEEVSTDDQDLELINLYTATTSWVHMATRPAERLIAAQIGALSTQHSGGICATHEDKLEERPQKKQLWE